MSEVVAAVFGFLGMLLMVGVAVGLLFSQQIMMFFAMKEIRKMASTLPEKDRERWLNDAIDSLGKGYEEARSQ